MVCNSIRYVYFIWSKLVCRDKAKSVYVCVYRARSRHSQEVVLNAAHVAAATDVDVLQMSGLEFIFGQHVLGHDAVGARGLHEQNHLVPLDLRLHELLRHFKADDRRRDGGRPRAAGWK